jgi:hypothetical protein
LKSTLYWIFIMKILKFVAPPTVRLAGIVFCAITAGLLPLPSDGAISQQESLLTEASAPAVEACGTWLELDRGGEGYILRESLSRPGDGPLLRESGHFRVHYQDAALESYADSILSASEKAYSVLIETLAYLQPPSDAPNGGDGRIDIYIQPSSGFPYLGVARPETWVGAPYANSHTSYIELTDTMGVDLLLTTTVHEFFHVIQIGYDKDENTSFLEMISVWSEERVYDEINAYRRHLSNFFSSPHKALFGHTYSNVVWAIYLTENFGDAVIKDILEACGAVSGNNIMQASEDILAANGTDMISEVNTFHLWNFFTGARDDAQHYEEGSSFPHVFIEETVDCPPLIGYTISNHKAGTMGCNYFEFYGDYHSDSLRFDLVPEYWAASTVGITRFTQGGISTDRYDYAQFTIDPPPIIDSSWREADSLLLVYTIESSALPSNGFGLSAAHSPAMPPAQPYVLILDRDGCRRPFDGINDDFSLRSGEDFPFASAMAEDSLLYVLSDSLPALLSHCDVIMIVGGYDATGTLFSAAELETLMAYMDRGGDVYIESDRLGEWMDPLLGQPTPIEEAFWYYFGCNFIPGDTMTVGNVVSWITHDHSPIGPFAYSYDGGSPADNFVGELVPTLAETLAVDQSDRVRATIHTGANDSYRIFSTVLLGASTPSNPESARNRYLFRILELFDSSVPALAVATMGIRIENGRVYFEGIIEGYNGELLSFARLNQTYGHLDMPVPLTVDVDGGKVRLTATDSPPAGKTYVYLLSVRSGQSDRVLWQGEVSIEGMPLSIRAIYPNPSTGDFTMFVESPGVETAVLRIYDAEGRLVLRRSEPLRLGSNEIMFDGRNRYGRRLSSGVYFLRLDSSGHSFHKKLVIVR